MKGWRSFIVKKGKLHNHLEEAWYFSIVKRGPLIAKASLAAIFLNHDHTRVLCLYLPQVSITSTKLHILTMQIQLHKKIARIHIWYLHRIRLLTYLLEACKKASLASKLCLFFDNVGNTYILLSRSLVEFIKVGRGCCSSTNGAVEWYWQKPLEAIIKPLNFICRRWQEKGRRKPVPLTANANNYICESNWSTQRRLIQYVVEAYKISLTKHEFCVPLCAAPMFCVAEGR